MGMATAGNVIGFTGTLVQRRQIPGKSYTQLVFSTTEGVRLSVSRNIRLCRTLTIGRTYRVKGKECLLGKKTYISEPEAVPISDKKNIFRNHWKITTIIALVILLGGSVAAFYTVKTVSNKSAAPQVTVAESEPTAVKAPASGTTLDATTVVPATPPATQPTSTTTTKKTTNKKVSTPSTPVVSSPVPTAQAPATEAATPAPVTIEEQAVVVDPSATEPPTVTDSGTPETP